jgi:hypothetical protein
MDRSFFRFFSEALLELFLVEFLTVLETPSGVENLSFSLSVFTQFSDPVLDDFRFHFGVRFGVFSRLFFIQTLP